MEASAFDVPPLSNPQFSILSAIEEGRNEGDDDPCFPVGYWFLKTRHTCIHCFALLFSVDIISHTYDIMTSVQQLFSLEGQTALVTGGTRGMSMHPKESFSTH